MQKYAITIDICNSMHKIKKVYFSFKQLRFVKITDKNMKWEKNNGIIMILVGITVFFLRTLNLKIKKKNNFVAQIL